MGDTRDKRVKNGENEIKARDNGSYLRDSMDEEDFKKSGDLLRRYFETLPLVKYNLTIDQYSSLPGGGNKLITGNDTESQ